MDTKPPKFMLILKQWLFAFLMEGDGEYHM